MPDATHNDHMTTANQLNLNVASRGGDGGDKLSKRSPRVSRSNKVARKREEQESHYKGDFKPWGSSRRRFSNRLPGAPPQT